MAKPKSFTYRNMHFEAVEGKDGERIRCRIYLVEKELGRRLQEGDLDPNAKYPGREAGTSFQVTGNSAIDQREKFRAADRLLAKAAGYLARRSTNVFTLADLYAQEIQSFLAYTAVRSPKSTQWNPETCASNRAAYERYLVPIYRRHTLPFDEADRQRFLQELEQLKRSTSSYNRLLNLHTQLMDYLSEVKGLYVGCAREVQAKAFTGQELLQRRMGSVRSFTPEFRHKLLTKLLAMIENDDPQAALALGVLIMFCMGLRTSEMLACTLEQLTAPLCYIANQKKNQTRSGVLKRDSSYRSIPVVTVLRRSAACRREAICRRLGLSAAEAGKLPAVGDDKDPLRMMDENVFAAAARKLFLTLGISDMLLKAYSDLMHTVPIEELRGEKSVCAYILRRDFITRLYNHTALDQKMISYLAGHAQEDKAVYLPNEAELSAALLAMEQAFGGTPMAAEAAPVPVCKTAYALSGGRVLQVIAAERGEPVEVTITGAPGTQVTLETSWRLEAPSASPVCRIKETPGSWQKAETICAD